MELRWSMCVLFLTALVSQCSVNGHTMHKREDYDDGFLGDEANDDWAQNDDGGNDDGEDNDVVGIVETKPMNYNVKMGSNVTMECRVTPNEGPVVQWSKNENALFIGNLKLQKLTRYNLDDATRSLLIQNVQPSDDGEYKCMVMVKANASSVVHRLVVLSAPNITQLTATNDGKVIEGSQLVLNCEVTGSPISQIMWSRERYPGSGNHRLGESDAKFVMNSATIENARPEDSGTYYCYAFNSQGNAQSEVHVTVLAKPHADLHRRVINTGLGDHALLQCTTKGEPTPSITWYKDNEKIIGDNKRFFISYDGPHSNLTVIPTEDKDFGTYTCVAENYHNKHSKSAELVQRPVVEEVEVDGRKLSWKLHSHLRLEHIELQFIDQMGNSTIIEIPLPKTQDKSYELKYEVAQEFTPGKYQAYIKAKNENDWNRELEPIQIEISEQPLMNIQRSSVYRVHGDGAHTHRLSSTCLLSTILIYLLVRMF